MDHPARELFEQAVTASSKARSTGLLGTGAFVRFGGGHEGMLPLRRLLCAVGAQPGGHDPAWRAHEETLRLGDQLRVVVERVDTARGRVDLVPVDVPDA
jgi:ribonuclease R